MTILREPQTTQDPATLALAALGWILASESRAERLLTLTGLTPDQLRGGLSDPAMLIAVLDFLASHEPDLTACAQSLGLGPAALIAARAELAR